VRTAERIEMATTTLPRGSSLPPSIGSVSVPLVLLRNLLEAAGGSISIDGWDMLTDIKGHLEVEKRLDPLNYRFRWVDE
jgi:hypothetical protein